MHKQLKQEKLKYFMYLRKSSEAEDRQVQSIDAQKRELDELAAEHEIEVLDVFEESMSAKAPGRPVFNKMMERIANGEANGLIVWKLNRLARNPVDGGTISWMLQERVIKHIQTFGRGYYPEDNVIVMAVELGMANQYVRDLSVDTKRGMRERVERGYPSGVAPIGYLNDLSAEPGSRGWIVDKDRFNLIRQMLELFHTGTYSIRGLMNEANEKMGLRTVVHKKQGGKKLVLSHVTETILKNPIFAGFFFTKDGVRHELNKDVPRMISESTYWENQKILGSRGRARASKNIGIFPYVGRTQCGGCGGTVTAEHKYQIICSECKFKFTQSKKTHCPQCETAIDDMKKPLHLHYIYYHCNKRKNPNCTEKSVSEEYIDGYLSTYYEEHLQISESLSKWCIDNLTDLGSSEKNDKLSKKTSLENTLGKKEKELKELAMMKARNLLDDGEFLSLKATVADEIRSLQKEVKELSHVDPSKIKKAERAFNLAVGVGEIFKNGDPKEKKEALSEIGSNLTIKEKKLNVINTNLYSIIIKGLLQSKKENPLFEPKFCEATQGQNNAFQAVCPTLLPRLHIYRTV